MLSKKWTKCHRRVIDESIYPVYTDKKTILLVEDNEDLRVLIAEILEKDYHIIQAGNGAAALERLNDENPDLILTDVMMPLVGGIELCRAVKQNIETSHIPVIMLTGQIGHGEPNRRYGRRRRPVYREAGKPQTVAA